MINFYHYCFSIALLKRRRVLEQKRKPPKCEHLDFEAKDILNMADTSSQRFKSRIKQIHQTKYSQHWRSRQFVNRLYTTQQGHKIRSFDM